MRKAFHRQGKALHEGLAKVTALVLKNFSLLKRYKLSLSYTFTNPTAVKRLDFRRIPFPSLLHLESLARQERDEKDNEGVWTGYLMKIVGLEIKSY